MLTFKHSGNIGDIIRSLPTLKALGGGKIYLFTGQPCNYGPAGGQHPAGSVMLNMQLALGLSNLLVLQQYITCVQTVDYFQGYKKILNKSIVIDYDLDEFRKMPINFQAGSIFRWYFYKFDVYPDLNQPWIKVKDVKSEDYVVVNRTFRYRNNIDYSFLNTLKYRVIFTGTKKQYDDFIKYVPNSEFYYTNNFLQLAQFIKSAKAFVGNQSFCYTLAQAMQINRVVEICPYCPVAIPTGKNGYDIYTQKGFEKAIMKSLETE